MKLTAVILSLAMMPLAALGQSEAGDSIAISHLSPGIEKLNDSISIYYNFDRKYSELSSSIQSAEHPTDSSAFDIPRDTNFTPGAAPISAWRNGAIYATGGIQTMPGLMAINSGSLNLYQSFGRFSVTAYATATKYGYFNGLQTSYGFGGAVSHRFSDKVSATIFGEYNTAVRIHQPALAGYVSVPNFGGFIDYSFSSKFGVEVGAQGYRSMITRRIEAQPIIKPYYRISKHSKIGIDVGGILYQVLNSRNSGYNESRNPTIGPPVQKLSQAMGY